MKAIRLDAYQTKRGSFEVWYDPKRDMIVQSGQDDLGHRFEDEASALEFIEDLSGGEDADSYMAALIESLRQDRAEIMVQWGVSIKAWEQARKCNDMSRLRMQSNRPDAAD